MDPLRLTIENLNSETFIESSRVLILITIPLTEIRFKKEKQKQGFLSKLLLEKPKEFVQLQRFLNYWEDYENSIVLPIFKEIQEIQDKSAAIIDYDVTFQDFKGAILSNCFDAIYLIAHHITTVQNNFIEFADGGETFSNVIHFLSTLTNAHKTALIFVVCEADIIESKKFSNLQNVKALGTAYWKIPLIPGFQFVKHWVVNFREPDKHTLSSAYSKAIIQFLNYNNNEPV